MVRKFLLEYHLQSIAKLLMLIGLSLFSINSQAAVPTLGVPNIIVPANSMPSFVSNDWTNNTDDKTNRLVEQQLTSFSIQVRSIISQNKQFKVININDKTTQFYMINESGMDNSEIESNIKQAPSLSAPDYILIGLLAAVNAGEEINPIHGTNKYSNIYSIDLAVDYKLVRTNDRTIAAEFTAAGHAGDVKIVNNPKQKIIHNMSQLVKAAGNNLASEVMVSLNEQIGEGKLDTNSQESNH